MKLNKLIRCLTFCLLTAGPVAAQLPEPAGYFKFPIKPGQQNYLSGTMGEIRSNHFHGGIDVKTDQKIGLPVYAAADGYVSRIKMSSYGYGNIIYLTHPNGKITTYAHLSEYAPALADYVLKKQYEQETFDIELFPEKNKFAFKKGDVIAYSGNTGGSGGPHLHFEIRDTEDNLYNPLQYRFSEIKDSTPPTVSAFALKTMSIDARVNGKFGWIEFR
ncbi:MAG: M23 family metallopeptidase, partial [Hymenobacteraceae bacterium]|nr:M23 family metallopeptidase [Hymenobacteraceae bacterium]MDX5395001.1 M23 family metallopeptidase [Hymenobacteraceae bacterium]MDX5511034.1 M23 family metallopeptidase [Hymenobacteraceae bacterium]